MKRIALLIFVLTIFLAPAKSESHPIFFAEGQQLYIVANAGLNLRDLPNKNSMTLTTIPYGQLVTVMPFDHKCIIIQEIDYVRGSWVKVSYDGYTGFVFDGFLSPLATPKYHAETSEGNVSIFNLIDNWVDIHLLQISSPDTISNEYENKIIFNFEGGEKFEKQILYNKYRTQLYLSGARIMDVYHLVKGFYTNLDIKEDIDINSTFIKNNEGDLHQIKIDLDQKCELKKMSNGQIRLTISESNTGC